MRGGLAGLRKGCLLRHLLRNTPLSGSKVVGRDFLQFSVCLLCEFPDVSVSDSFFSFFYFRHGETG